MTTEGYNGYSNYSTWNVALWIANDEYLYKYWDRKARYARVGNDASEACAELAEMLEAEIRWLDSFGDLNSKELHEVNWPEVAGTILEE